MKSSGSCIALSVLFTAVLAQTTECRGAEASPRIVAPSQASFFDRMSEEQKITFLKTALSRLSARITELETKTQALSYDESGSYPKVVFSGVNVQVVNGLGCSADDAYNERCVSNGTGNLIIGYNAPRSEYRETPSTADSRSGSHNLILGNMGDFTSQGGIIGGSFNSVEGWGASVLTGSINSATARGSVVLGGFQNQASGEEAIILGGSFNSASGDNASILGGHQNTASANTSIVIGGENNTASGSAGIVSGGQSNVASGTYASISGGYRNTSSGRNASVSGGADNTAEGSYASISGGSGNTASGSYSTVSGGSGNSTAANYSTVSGGRTRTANSIFGWVAGSLSEAN